MTTESVPKSSPAKKSPGKAKKSSSAPASHPPYQAMVKAAVKNIKDRQGASRAAILKYIVQNYTVGHDVKKISAHLRAALKRGVSGGGLKQAKGTGANGRFRLSDSAKKASPKKAVKPKPAAKKPTAKKSSPKKKAPVAKKAASPKKAKSPVKATKKIKSPKKALKKTKTPKKAAPKKA